MPRFIEIPQTMGAGLPTSGITASGPLKGAFLELFYSPMSPNELSTGPQRVRWGEGERSRLDFGPVAR
jgi:hypothetical protein